MNRNTFLFILMLPIFAFAQEGTSIGLHLGSHHYPDPNGRANNVNPGAYIRLENGLTAGFYLNSWRKDTAYIGWTTHEWMRTSITFGIASGYREEMPIAIAVPTFRLASVRAVDGRIHFADEAKPGVYSVRMALIPKFREDGMTAIHMMIERTF